MMLSRKERRVLVIQGQIKRYRLSFFEKLYAVLAQDGLRLRVGYSDPPPVQRLRSDNCDLPSEYGAKVRGFRIFGNKVVWQPLLGEVSAAELVIVEQANKYILNHLLLLYSFLNVKKLAFWGLGENKQEGRLAASEWYRRKILRRPDWWFAYTKGTADYLTQHGVPRGKITAIQNSIDTRELRERVTAIPQDVVCEEKVRLGIAAGAPTGVFCGMLAPVKSIPFLIESAMFVKREIPEFHLIIAGGGPDAPVAEASASASGGWIHYVGPKFGEEKALILKMADVFLLPGRVGLAVLDAFAAGLPLLTTDIPIHGPEVEYLEDGVNGLIAQHETEAYAETVIRILSDPCRLKVLRNGAVKAAGQYSMEAMVQNFHQGILCCLGMRVGETA